MISPVSSAIIRKTTPPIPSAHPFLANDYWPGEIEVVSKPYILMYLDVRINSDSVVLRIEGSSVLDDISIDCFGGLCRQYLRSST